jgi:hypothetical protein
LADQLAKDMEEGVLLTITAKALMQLEQLQRLALDSTMLTGGSQALVASALMTGALHATGRAKHELDCIRYSDISPADVLQLKAWLATHLSH